MILTPKEGLDKLHKTVERVYRKTDRQPLTFELNRIFQTAPVALEQNNHEQMYRVLRCYLIVIAGHALLADQRPVQQVVSEVKDLLAQERANRHVSAM